MKEDSRKGSAAETHLNDTTTFFLKQLVEIN